MFGSAAWAPSASANGANSREPKRPRTEGGRELTDGQYSREQQRLLVMTARQTVRNTADIAALKGTVFRTFIFAASSDLNKAIRGALTDYRALVHGQKGHKHGQPDKFVWHACMKCTAAHFEGLQRNNASAPMSTIDQAHLNALAEHSKQCESPAALVTKVHHAHIFSVYKKEGQPEEARLEIGVHSSLEAPCDALAAYISTLGGHECEGAAPRGQIQREMQALLDKIK